MPDWGDGVADRRCRVYLCVFSQLLKRSQRLRANNAYITPAAFNMRSALKNSLPATTAAASQRRTHFPFPHLTC